MKYLKQFNNHEGYTSFTATTAFVKPNVSICIQDVHTHFNPKTCEVTSEYEIIGTPSYPSTIEGDVTSFDIEFDYKRTDTDNKCRQTVTSGSDSVTVECGQNPSTSDTRTVSGTVNYHGIEIEYSVEQSKFEAKVTAKFNVTSTSSPTRIASATTGFSKIVIDGVEMSPRTGYTFSTTGEHTVKYYLNKPSIPSSAFTSCASLTNVVISNTVTYINDSAFIKCTGLTSITIPDSVTSISGKAFSGCTNLPVVDNIRYADTYAVEVIDNTLSSYTLKSGTRFIGYLAFQGCSGLTSIDIPNSVISIDDYAFTRCSGLTSITIPDSVTKIGNWTFKDCSGLTDVTIGSGVTSIGISAFTNCTSLTSIEIPDSVTSIGGSAFYGCTSLPVVNNIRYADTYAVEVINNTLSSYTLKSGTRFIGDSVFQECTSLTSIDIPNSVISIGSNAFYNCRSLTSIDIPSGVTKMDNYTFYQCTSLKRLNSDIDGTFNIPSGVTIIGGNAFRGCTSLTSVVIPSGVTIVYGNAFRSCTGITSIISNAITAPTIYNSTFDGVKSSGKLYVPIGSSGYDVWMGANQYYLGYYNWTKVEQ